MTNLFFEEKENLSIHLSAETDEYAKHTTRRKSSKKGRTADALAISADEGRDKLRKAAVRCK